MATTTEGNTEFLTVKISGFPAVCTLVERPLAAMKFQLLPVHYVVLT
jgi:hypothetical protein